MMKSLRIAALAGALALIGAADKADDLGTGAYLVRGYFHDGGPDGNSVHTTL